MALSKLPDRATPICVECMPGPTAYARGGFTLHVSCIPGLRDERDILSLYIRTKGHCGVMPAISGILGVGGASGLQFSNDIQIVCFGALSGTICADKMAELSAGADLSDITFCVAVKGR